MGATRPKLTLEDAEIIALKALAFLAGDAERLGRFLALSGVDPGYIGAAAKDSAFLAGILNYLMQDESLLLTFASEQDLDLRQPAMAVEILNRLSD